MIVGILIVACVLLAYQTRDRSDEQASSGDSNRVESVGSLTDEPLGASEPGVDQTEGSDRPTLGSPESAPDPSTGAAPLEIPPESEPPTTASSGTKPPTTTPPATDAPATEAPSTPVPNTGAPNSKPPTSETPATTEPRPTTEAPITAAPTTNPPVTKAPTTTPPAPPIPPVALVNGGFDAIDVADGEFVILSGLAGWESSAGEFEIWDSTHNGVDAVGGASLLELNARGPGYLYQDFATTPGSVIRWEFFHRGRNGRESTEFGLGSARTGVVVPIITAATGQEWKRYTGTYVVPEGQTSTRLAFRSLQPGGSGNLIDSVSVSLDRD